MLRYLQIAGWLACVIYATIPSFWLMIHPRAEYWRRSKTSPYRFLLPLWAFMWIALSLLTLSWRNVAFYTTPLAWIPAAALFVAGIWIYRQAGAHFSWRQLGGLPELRREHGLERGSVEQQLVVTGIRSRVRHPIYLGHLCEMLAWSIGTGLIVCWGLTAFAIITGAAMIRMEDAELENRFGEDFRHYRSSVPAVLPRR